MFAEDLVERALAHGDAGLRADYEPETAEWVDGDPVDLEEVR